MRLVPGIRALMCPRNARVSSILPSTRQARAMRMRRSSSMLMIVSRRRGEGREEKGVTQMTPRDAKNGFARQKLLSTPRSPWLPENHERRCWKYDPGDIVEAHGRLGRL